MVTMIRAATATNTTYGSKSARRSTSNEPTGALNEYFDTRTASDVARTLGPRPPYQAVDAIAATKNRKTGAGYALLSAYVAAKAIKTATIARAYREAESKS
jgi:hypothetical protein